MGPEYFEDIGGPIKQCYYYCYLYKQLFAVLFNLKLEITWSANRSLKFNHILCHAPNLFIVVKFFSLMPIGKIAW
jgi:hypothetical protein